MRTVVVATVLSTFNTVKKYLLLLTTTKVYVLFHCCSSAPPFFIKKKKFYCRFAAFSFVCVCVFLSWFRPISTFAQTSSSVASVFVSPCFPCPPPLSGTYVLLLLLRVTEASELGEREEKTFLCPTFETSRLTAERKRNLQWPLPISSPPNRPLPLPTPHPTPKKEELG